MPEVEEQPVAIEVAAPESVAVEVAAPESVQPPAPPDPKKFRREIQPKDKDGKPVGQPHVYYGATEQEVADKMAEAISNGTVKIHELTLKEKMANTQLPEGAEPEVVIAIPKPRELTADERFQIAEKMKNPETVVEGYRELHQAEFGRTPEQEREARLKAEHDAAKTAERAEAQAFCEAHPDYLISPKNGSAMLAFLAARKMARTVKNFEIAYKELSADGLLETAPVQAPTPEVVIPEPVAEPATSEPVIPVAAESTPRTEAPAARTRTAIPSSLSRDQASGTGAVKPKKPSAAEIAMMSPAEFRAYAEREGQWGK